MTPLAWLTVLAAIAVGAAVAPAVSGAQNCAPSGNGQIDQYSESIPGDCGNAPFDPSGGGSQNGAGSPSAGGTGASGSAGSTLSPAALAALEAQGADGATLAALAAASGPSDQPGSTGGSAGRDRGGTSLTSGAGVPIGSAPSISGVLAGLGEATSGGSSGNEGVGIMLPLLLVLILAGGIAFAARKRASD